MGVTGNFYGDYLYWNTTGVTWAVGSENIELGRGASYGFGGGATGCVALGMSAGGGKESTIAIGNNAGRGLQQGANSIAIGAKAAPDTETSSASANTISIGGTSGSRLDFNCDNAVAVGACAGQDCRIGSIAIGNRANSGFTAPVNSSYSVVIGSLAGLAGVNQQAIVIGNNASSEIVAGEGCVIVGPNAGTTLAGSVVIGKAASLSTDNAAMTKGIVINGTNALMAVTGSTGPGFWVKPVRQITGIAGITAQGFTGPVYYNITSGEFAVLV